MPGGTQRLGPANDTGEARSLHIGSVRMFSPASCTRRVECPTHVSVSCDAGARGLIKEGDTRRNTEGSGSMGRGRVVRCTSIHLSRPPNPGTACFTQGF